MATSPKELKTLCHITHIDNMGSILTAGLRPRSELRQEQDAFQDIADHNILDGRENYRVALSQYVPFHFFVKNPFDWAVAGRFGAKNLVIISIWRNYAQNNGGMIIPSHPLNTGTPEFLPYNEGLGKMKWELMEPGEQRYYNSHPEAKQACMAECDLPQTVPVSAFAFLKVYDEEAKRRVLALPGADAIRNKLEVNPNMFPPLPDPSEQVRR